MSLEVISPKGSKYVVMADYDHVAKVITMKIRSRFTPLKDQEHETESHAIHLSGSHDSEGPTP